MTDCSRQPADAGAPQPDPGKPDPDRPAPDAPRRRKPWKPTIRGLIETCAFAAIGGVVAFQLGPVRLNDFITAHPGLSLVIVAVSGMALSFVSDVVSELYQSRATPPEKPPL